jgi:phage repressor protein C with HTH and peptisase S24 domain
MSDYIARVIADLQAGKTVLHRGKGNSMTPLIHSGDLQTLVPVTDPSTLKKGDAVLCKVRGSVFTHKITAIKGKSGELQFQISNNHGHVNGWTRAVYGKLIAVNDHPV